MPDYVRPPLADQVFRDAAGAVIPYGRRWGDRLPPDDTYSVDSHPERFAPLHDVADALVAHLIDNYDVEAHRDRACAADLLHDMPHIVRAVRLTPSPDEAAPLTIVMTGYPAVAVHAGLLHDFIYPDCGCDACDETAESQAEQLESLALGVAAGRFQERYVARAATPVRFSLTTVDGGRSGSSAVSPGLRARLGEARKRLPARGWTAWAPRS